MKRLVAAIAIAALFSASTASQGTNTYTLLAANGRRPLPFRPAAATDFVSLEQLAGMFDLRVQDDPQAGGTIVQARGQRILLTPGQPLVSVNGRIVSLSGPVQRDGQGLWVPMDFLSRALGPTIGQRIEVRRGSHLVILGDLRVPQITPRVERIGPNSRVTVDVQPPTPHRTSREGSRLVIRFEAEGLDLAPMAGTAPEFVGAPRAEGAALTLDLGPSAVGLRTDDADPAHVVIDIAPNAAASPAAPAPPAPPAGRPGAPPESAPMIDLSQPTGIRTVAIDPGHGGDDAGAHGAGGASEKDLTLQTARRLKAAIESRLGLRVLLTRDSDEAVAIDRRTALANNNKADLLISLHANASVRPSLRGVQVLSLSLDDYKDRSRGLPASLPVPVVGGGTRTIDAMPWDLAQIPHVPQSAAFAAIVVRRLTEQKVPSYARSIDEAPLRVLVGANMPAVLVEMGFLTNADDEKALTGGDLPGAIVEALVGAVAEVRGGIAATPEPAR